MNVAKFNLITGDSKNGPLGILAANVVDERCLIEHGPIQASLGGFLGNRAQLLVLHAADQQGGEFARGGVLDSVADLHDLPAGIKLRRLHEKLEILVLRLALSVFFQASLKVVVPAADEQADTAWHASIVAQKSVGRRGSKAALVKIGSCETSTCAPATGLAACRTAT